MIKSDRRARMMLGRAMDGGDLAVADLVQHLGAEGAWAKITEGALGEPAAETCYSGFDTLRSAVPVMILAPILGAVGLTRAARV
jgi:hypothetical protein